jgi:NAD(P)H dehydrogenase (quinone)
MNILVVLGHPKKGSFNHAIADTTVKALKSLGHKVVFHDLYAEKFDPVLKFGEMPADGKVDANIKKYCGELVCAEGIVVIHPNWWGQPPSILKGWVDRVLRAGVAFEFKEGDSGEGIPIGLLKAEKAVVFNTSNTREERELNRFGDPLERLWKTCIFDLCGVKNVFRRTFSPIVTSTLAQRETWLEEAAEIIKKEFPRK